MPFGFPILFGKSSESAQPQNSESFLPAQSHPNEGISPAPQNRFSSQEYTMNGPSGQVNDNLSFANVAQLGSQTMPRVPPASGLNTRANPRPFTTIKEDTSLTDMMGKAKELGLPLIVVSVTNNCSSPMSPLPKVDVSLPGAHVLVNEQPGEAYQASTMLGCTPARNQPLELDLLDLPNNMDCNNAEGEMNEEPPNGRAAGALSPEPRSACSSMYMPSVSALSMASDDDEGFEESGEINPTAHYRQLIQSTDEAMIQAASASHNAMRAHGIREDSTAYLKTCQAISTALRLTIVHLGRRDHEAEGEHRFLRTSWYSKLKERLDSLERNLGNLKTCTEAIQQRLKQTETFDKALTLDIFDRWNSRLKAYLAKFENINTKLESAFDRMDEELIRPRLDDANENIQRTRVDYEDARERYHSAKAHRARLQRHLTSSSRRGGRHSVLLS